jgi:hypothetical protein
MFESLQEGIVVIKNEVITFKNKIFTQLYSQGDHDEEETPFLDLKIFKVFRKADSENISNDKTSKWSESYKGSRRSHKSSAKSILDFGNVFSLKQLIKLDQK